MTFGYYDEAFKSDNLVWNNIEIKTQAGIRIQNILVGGKDIGLCDTKKNKEIEKGCFLHIDSGTTNQGVPDYAFALLEKNNIPTTNFGVLCENQEQFGDLTYIINN